MDGIKIEYLPLKDLKAYENNARKHGDEDLQAIMNSIKEFGFNDPIGIWSDKNIIVEGHGRLIAAKKLKMDTVPCIRLDHMTDEQRRAYTLAHNKTAELSAWDFDMVDLEIENIADIDMTQFGFEFEVKEEPQEINHGALNEKFIVPPFSVLDARQGYWLERKRIWREKIGDRGQARDVAVLDTHADYIAQGFADASLLDPVLCEIMLKWFAPKGGSTFDVFAGDTMFGYVSSYLGHKFDGIELRQEQCDFNTNACEGLPARYICDDGRNVLKHLKPETKDFFFSCPPYFDLEVYSDKENDASNQETYEDFYAILDSAFTDAIKVLKNNRFAVVVCGDVRNRKTGEYYGFPESIKETFLREGCGLYNELILVDPIGTAAVRSARGMKNRKVAKVHQNVLVFYKGDTKKIQEEFHEIEVEEDESTDF